MKQVLLKKHSYIFLLILFLFATSGISKISTPHKLVYKIKKKDLYSQLNLATLGLKQSVFEMALAGWNKLNKVQQLKNAGLLSIIDMSQSSNAKRLYVVDVEKEVLLFNTYVAHGRNSGGEFASNFANKLNSFKSSLGFYITGNTYQGKHGLSLRLKGIEKGINDDAEKRGIVMHGASYVSEEFIKQCGRLGRSEGCPAVPEDLCTPIIDYIKEGSCVYVYYPDKSYLKCSKLVAV